MVERDHLDRWIRDLRDRLARGDLGDLGPIALGDGAGPLAGDLLVRVILADLDDLDDPAGSWRVDGNRDERRHGVVNDLRRLRELIG